MKPNSYGKENLFIYIYVHSFVEHLFLIFNETEEIKVTTYSSGTVQRRTSSPITDGDWNLG